MEEALLHMFCRHISALRLNGSLPLFQSNDRDLTGKSVYFVILQNCLYQPVSPKGPEAAVSHVDKMQEDLLQTESSCYVNTGFFFLKEQSDILGNVLCHSELDEKVDTTVTSVC